MNEQADVRDPREVLTRPARPPDWVLRYGRDAAHVIDVRLPTVVRHPPVVFVHGGFWRAEYDRRHTGPLAADLADRGWPVACIEYRRVGQPGGGYPGTFDDVATAIDASIAAALGDGPPIVAGHSAGGALALWYAARHPTGIGGVLALAPVADFTGAYQRAIGDHAVRDLLGGGPDDVPERYAVTDPLRLAQQAGRTEPTDDRAEQASSRTAPPATIVHGTADQQVPVELSRAYAAVSATSLVELAGVDHFAVIDPRSVAWPSVLLALEDLVGRSLGR